MRVLLLLLLLTACGRQLTVQEQDFKQQCQSEGRMWMYMDEMHDGKVTGPACYGCMKDEKNHVCSPDTDGKLNQ